MRVWLGVLAVAALIFVAGGPVALAVPLLACLPWLLLRRPGRAPTRDSPTGSRTGDSRTGDSRTGDSRTGDSRTGDPAAWLPWIALAAMVASGLLCAVRPFGQGLFGPFGWPAQAFALVALAAALTPAVAVPSRLRPAAGQAPTPEEDR